MSPTSNRGARPAARSCPAPLDRQGRIELLLEETKRRVVSIRRTFVQQGHGPDTKHGPLHTFLTAHDERGLDAYLLVHAMASASRPWNCRVPSEVWVSALGLDEAATPSSAKTAVSKVMRRLEKRKLVTRVRSQRLSDVRLLMEDGSGEPYEPRSPERVEDRWLQLPHAYWLEGHYKTLRLPAKVMLLVALSRPKDGFPMPYEYVPDWYGVSSDSAEEGLRELRNVGLLTVVSNWVKAPRSKIGWTEQLLYTLQGSFSKAERAKASRIRNPTPQADVEPIAPVRQMPIPDQLLGLAPVVRRPTIAEFMGLPSPSQGSA
jgi:hypothetical protein